MIMQSSFLRKVKIFISYKIVDGPQFFVAQLAKYLEKYTHLIEKVYYWDRDQTSDKEILEFMGLT